MQLKVRAVNEVLNASKELNEAVLQQHLKGGDVASLTADVKKAQAVERLSLQGVAREPGRHLLLDELQPHGVEHV